MRFKTVNSFIFAGLASLAIQGVANADESTQLTESIVPSVNPSSLCGERRFKVPEGMREYTALINKDCSTYFVMPPAVNKKEYEVYTTSNLRLCEALDTQNRIVESLEKTRGKTAEKIAKLQEKEPANEEEEERINKKIADLQKRLKELGDMANEERERIGESYGDIEGATFSVLLDSRVLENDLDAISFENRYLQVVKDENGNVVSQETVYPKTYRAKVASSTYSFVYRSPEKRHGSDSILHTSIPGLQTQQKDGTDLSTAHVQGGDLVSGEIVMSLIGTCPGAKENEDGVFELHDSKKRPIFVVNRTYGVQQQIQYGYTASLNANETVNQMVREIIATTNNGFKKDQTFKEVLTAEDNKALNFEWTSDYTPEDNQLTAEMIQDIKDSIFAKLADDYFEELVKLEKIHVKKPEVIVPADGGYVDVDKTGTRCWIERKWWGHHRKKCGNYTYQVKEWRNGITETELATELTLNKEFKETFITNQMVPFYFTSTFTK